MKNWKHILAWLGLICGLIGLVCVIGSCGGIEHGGSFRLGASWVLAGLGLIGLGALALKIALN